MLLFIFFFAIHHIAKNISMKLSVFVVTYNQEEFIKRALDSVLMQKVSFNYEIIIGEDCSTDSTPRICDEYAAKYPFIRVYHHKQNKGLVKNWEFVFNHCRGEYVAMLEGDDYWLSKNKLQKQVEWLDEHPDFVITSTNVRVVSKRIEDINRWFVHRREGVVAPIEYLNPGIAQTSSVIIRNVTKDITYPHWMYVTDTYTFLWICNFGKAYHFEEEMSVYWRHEEGVSWIHDNPHALHLYKCLSRQYEYMCHFFKDGAVSEECRKVAINNCKYVIYAEASSLKSRTECIFRNFRLENLSIMNTLSVLYTYVLKPLFHLR